MPETMTQADNFWLCMDEPVNLMVITGFWEFAEPPGLQSIVCNSRSTAGIVSPVQTKGGPAQDRPWNAQMG